MRYVVFLMGRFSTLGIVGSVVLHGALAAGLWHIGARAPHTASRKGLARAIEWTVRPRPSIPPDWPAEQPSTLPARVAPSQVPAAIHGAPPPDPARRPAAIASVARVPLPGARSETASPSPDTGPHIQSPPAARAPIGSPPAAPARVDLFPRGALCQAIGCVDGPPQGAALQEFLAQQQAERDGVLAVQQGRVDPVWRDIERDLDRSFAPKLESVSAAPRGELAARQLLRPVTPAPEQSQTGWLLRQDTANRLRAEILAAQDAYDEPAVGREVEIEVEIDGDGAVVSIRLLRPSGSRSFDDGAVHAVREAVRRRPIRDPGGAVVARYALRGEVAINLPRVTPGVEANGGQVSGVFAGISGTFDETTGKGSVRVPLAKRLKTRVRLMSVRRKLPVTGAASGAPSHAVARDAAASQP